MECTCTCQVSGFETAVTSIVSIAGGAIAITLSFAMAGSPVSLFSTMSTGAWQGAGTSLIVTPIKKYLNGERMTWTSSWQDFRTGFLTGKFQCYNKLQI